MWLLKALGLAAVAAVICAWLALCLLYYLGSWRLVLHPSRTVDRSPASLDLPYEEIQFDATETGQPRLTGWWIPATPSAPSPQPTGKYAADTILYLHDGSGSLASSLPTLALIHAVGINIFAIDYRGFGRSEGPGHPTSSTMSGDSSSALQYLLATRHIPAGAIIPYGQGLGASLAVELAKSHPDLPAVILDNPDPDPVATAVRAHPSHLVPIRLLYHENFEISAPLAALRTPKLLIVAGANGQGNGQTPAMVNALFRSAASPKFSVTLGEQNPDTAYHVALGRFLDQYLPHTDAAPAGPAR